MPSLQARVVGLALPPIARWIFRDGVTVAKMRSRSRVTKAPDGVRVERVETAGRRMEWLIPEGTEEEQVMFFLHGGGWCSGSVDTHRAFAGRLAKMLRIRTLHLTYRLAPEDPFPAALEDCVAAFRWLIASGVSAANLVIAGNSAGAGLAISTVLVLRDAGEAVPAGLVCLSPTVDLALTGGSIRSNRRRDVLTPAFLQQVCEWYVAGQDPYSPLISPLYADLRGLPPTLVLAGGHEVLLDDAIGLASRAREAGVDVTLRLWPGLVHTFEQMTLLPESAQAIGQIDAFVNRAIHPISRSDAAPRSSP
jgi:monoterpene epsilon-lactone hydrolase